MEIKNKKGMSLASTVGIMTVLLMMITMMFTYTMNNTKLITKMLNYTYSYNEAAMAIDNAKDNIKRELNNMSKDTRTENSVSNLNYDTSHLYDVHIIETIETDDSGMLTKMVVEISRQYNAGILFSTVEFSSSGGALIIEELFDHENYVLNADSKKQDYAHSFRASDMAFAYWDEQFNNRTNYLLEKCRETSSRLETQWPQAVKKDANLGNGNASNNAAKREYLMYTMIEELYGAVENAATSAGNWYNTEERRAWVNSGNSNAGIVISGKKMKVDNLYEGSAPSITVKNNSILCVSGDMIINCNLYIEKGSTVIVRGNCEFKNPKVDNWGNFSGSESLTKQVDIDTCVGSNSEYYGGGLMTLGSINYVLGSKATMNPTYGIKGVFWTAGKSKNNSTAGKINFDNNEKNNPIRIGATIYSGQGGEVKLRNLRYDANRPTFIMGNSEVYVIKCASEVVGDKWGLAFFIVSKFQFDLSNTDAFKANFYLYADDKTASKELGQMIDQWNKQADAVIGNKYVTKDDLTKVIASINDWYIPPILRGELIFIATSTSKTSKSTK